MTNSDTGIGDEDSFHDERHASRISDNGSDDEDGMNDKRSIGPSGVPVGKDIGRQGRPVARLPLVSHRRGRAHAGTLEERQRAVLRAREETEVASVHLQAQLLAESERFFAFSQQIRQGGSKIRQIREAGAV